MATAAEIASRNERIVVMRLQHPKRSWVDIAAEFEVSERTAREAWSRHLKEGRRDLAFLAEDYVDTVVEKISAFEQLRDELAEIGKSAGANDGARVGALKAIVDIHKEEITLLQKTKLLPQDLGAVRVQLDLERLGLAMMEVIAEFVPKAKRDKAEVFLLEKLRKKPQLALTPAKDETDAA